MFVEREKIEKLFEDSDPPMVIFRFDKIGDEALYQLIQVILGD